MQAAFTKKTQEIAQAKKEAESLRGKAEAYGKYESYIPIIEEMMTAPKAASNPQMAELEAQLKTAGYSDEAIEMMKMGAGFVLNTINQEKSSEREQQALSQKIEEAGRLDPRLSDTSLVYQTADGGQASFGEIVEQLVSANPTWRSDPIAATRKAIATLDALTSKAKTEGKQELSASAQEKASKFPNVSSSPQSAASNAAPASMQEAAAQAKKQLGIAS